MESCRWIHSQKRCICDIKILPMNLVIILSTHVMCQNCLTPPTPEFLFVYPLLEFVCWKLIQLYIVSGLHRCWSQAQQKEPYIMVCDGSWRIQVRFAHKAQHLPTSLTLPISLLPKEWCTVLSILLPRPAHARISHYDSMMSNVRSLRLPGTLHRI